MIVTKSGEEVYITSEYQALRGADPVHYLIEGGFAGFKIEVL